MCDDLFPVKALKQGIYTVKPMRIFVYGMAAAFETATRNQVDQ